MTTKRTGNITHIFIKNSVQGHGVVKEILVLSSTALVQKYSSVQPNGSSTSSPATPITWPSTATTPAKTNHLLSGDKAKKVTKKLKGKLADYTQVSGSEFAATMGCTPSQIQAMLSPEIGMDDKPAHPFVSSGASGSVTDMIDLGGITETATDTSTAKEGNEESFDADDEGDDDDTNTDKK